MVVVVLVLVLVLFAILLRQIRGPGAGPAALVSAKAGLGEVDLQPRYLRMRDYTFLKNSAKNSGVDVRLWVSGSGSQIALYPNLNTNDEGWRKLFRDVRIRRALSLAIEAARGDGSSARG